MISCDIAIIGGGIIGTSVAHFLARSGQASNIVIFEADSSYRHAATPAGAGGCRQLFSLSENIAMSRYSIAFYRDFARHLAGDKQAVDIDFDPCGYLFVVGEGGAQQLEANHKVQTAAGVDARLLDRHSLSTLFPDLVVDDIRLGCFSPADATFTTAKILSHWRRHVEALGVRYVAGRVTALAHDKGVMRQAVLADGRTVRAEAFVNAGGALGW